LRQGNCLFLLPLHEEKTGQVGKRVNIIRLDIEDLLTQLDCPSKIAVEPVHLAQVVQDRDKMRPLFEEGLCQLFPSFIISKFHEHLKFFMLAGKIQAIFQRITQLAQGFSQSLFQLWNGFLNIAHSFIIRPLFEELPKCTQGQRYSSVCEIGACQPKFNLGPVGR
jgi:hypothetical protein